MLTMNRITKVIGESFKIHAQALSGYEDSLTSPNDENHVTPPLDARRVEALEMQTAY